MCLGIPYEIVEIVDQDSAVLKLGNTTRHCFIGLLEDVQVGDWVLLHAGQAIEKISASEAQENLKLIHLYMTGETAEDST
ncbi:HypC/HybG/HupF family hydrogenase formation chaperone [Meiothermus cerbereus]|jgi:hydrogenase expression/formation protein HypC|uniref:HypC/HybG/HupF family hydrogenase formation chaperone n=1 Tax=Meiothermus cerbereus TaxID=65552 RepID=UPI003EEE616C